MGKKRGGVVGTRDIVGIMEMVGDWEGCDDGIMDMVGATVGSGVADNGQKR